MGIDRSPGRCALYGDCGRTSKFGDPLPCSNNSRARKLDPDAQQRLQAICGPGFAGPVCCTGDQVEQLERNLKKAAPIIDSCPACKENFFQVFCRFTCSPDQAQFVEVLATKKSIEGNDVVSELNYYVEPQLASAVYNSCAEVKFSATNGRAMDLVGGGAREYRSFFKFLGDEKPMLGGSPFQINFPWDYDTPPRGIVPSNALALGCADSGQYHCSCVDCPAACPKLPEVTPPNSCEFAGLNCVSWELLLSYFTLLLVVFGLTRRYKRRRQTSATGYEIQRIIDDDDDDDDDDDENHDVVDPFSEPANPNFHSETYGVNRLLQAWLTKTTYFCAKFPLSVITLCTLLALVCSLGIFWVDLLDEPAKLWVGPNSIEAKEKDYFEDHFGKFYRTAQMFAVNETGPIMQDYDTMKWWFDVEDRVAQTRSKITYDSLHDFCLQPIGDSCVVQSVAQYFGGNINRLRPATWQQQIKTCANSPVRCLPSFQQPIQPNLVFGPYNESVLDTHALVSTWVLVNDDSPAYTSRVEQWELAIEDLFLQVAQEAELRGLRVSFNLESSLARELVRSSGTDVKVIVISYIIMFLYASLSLGGRIKSSGKQMMLESKMALGLFGIFVVALSAASSIGICAILGIRMTLIITEVIPFLVLAIGVDNIFLLVHHMRLLNDLYSQYSVEERLSESVGLIGPSILLSSSCEVVAIAIGAYVTMPAVRNFAIYSALAVAINTGLQLTMFVAAMALDQRRVEAGRADCFPWLVVANQSQYQDDIERSDPFESQMDPRRFSMAISGEYAPFIFRKKVKLVVVSVFVTWLAISLALIPQMELGLDQRLAVPTDSFLVDYFSDVYSYFEAGPPVYFVTKHEDVEYRAEQQALCGRFSTCEEDSLMNILEQERKRPDLSYIDSPTASWIDDFMQWLNPSLDSCCLETDYGQLCAHEGCDCSVCYKDKPYSFNMTGLPEGSNFTHYLQLWLSAPSNNCPLAGKAPYSSAISLQSGNKVAASHFRTAHRPLRSQADYIDAYASARRIADTLAEDTGLQVFPYSIFYVFFAQYKSIVRDAVGILGAALAVVCLLATIFLGSVTTAIVVTAVVLVMICNIAGLMVILGISLNALSLVNLVICVGIGVEFCIHIARAFTFVHKVNTVGVQGLSRIERAFNALAGTGNTVFGGIAITKLLGVLVLAFAHSKLFDVYYFRMWLALVFCATIHSLALLPVVLSYCGGKYYMLEDAGLVDQFGELEL